MPDAPKGVTCLAFTPDGHFLVGGGWDKTVRVWEVAQGHLQQSLGPHGGAVSCVAVSADGTMLASGGADRVVRVFGFSSGTCLHELALHHGVAFSGTDRVVSASWDKTVRLWDIDTGAAVATLHGHASAVVSVAFSSTGTLLASGDRDGHVRLWQLG